MAVLLKFLGVAVSLVEENQKAWLLALSARLWDTRGGFCLGPARGLVLLQILRGILVSERPTRDAL